jgi:branched-chain amino acid transport system substrate-binding protein
MRIKPFFIAGAALMLAACGGTVGGGGGSGCGTESTQPLKIGVITGLTGAYVQLGEEQKNGAELAVKLLGGKVGNRPLQVIVRDDQLKPDVALREAQSLVQAEKVDFLTGCVSAATTLAMNQIASQAGIPYLGACQTEQLNRPPNFNPASTYHLAPTPGQFTNAASPYICDQLGKKVFLLMPDYAFGHEQETGYKPAIAKQSGCSVAGTAYFPLGTTDYTPYVPKIQGSGADVLVFGGAGRDQVSFLRQAQQFGLTGQLKTYLSLEDLSFDQELGFPLVAGTWAGTAFWWNVDDPGVQKYVKAYKDAYGKAPGGYGVYSYNAVNLVAQAVKDGKSSPQDFRSWMENRKVDLGQPLTVRSCDHQAMMPLYIVQGLTADQAQSQGGDAQAGYRKVVKTVPGDSVTPSCDEVKQPFKAVS